MPKPITYEWLAANGFIRLDRLERQPFDQMQRAICLECVGDRFMVAPEDLCITMAPGDDRGETWFCWISKAHAFHRNPHVWIHVRHLSTQTDVIRLYEGLTGRRWSAGGWDRNKWGEEIPDA